jgi:hypothetical protein
LSKLLSAGQHGVEDDWDDEDDWRFWEANWETPNGKYD